MNMVLTSVVFVTGLSGITLTLGIGFPVGMILAALVAMGLSLLFYVFDKFGWINKEEAAEPENEFTELADDLASRSQDAAGK